MSSVTEHKTDHLKFLLEAVPPGFVVDAAWLAQQGISRSLTFHYEQRGWLERVTTGLYRRPFTANDAVEDAADWRPFILSLQHILHNDAYVGGASALALHGHSHYLRFNGAGRLYLYGAKLPGWLKRLPIQTTFAQRKPNLFGEDRTGIKNQTDTASPWRWPLVASTPERAILEALDELPRHDTFHQIDTGFQGLANLSPKRLMTLLTLCKSVKVKRLFFVFADRHHHAWLKHLDRDAINLGSGPRALVEGGKMHPIYRIYVPAEFAIVTHEGGTNGA